MLSVGTLSTHLQLAIGVGDQLCEMGDGASVDDCLRELKRVLADIAQRRRGNALE